MIIWRGFGCLALPAGFIGFLLVAVLVDASKGDGFYSAHGWPKVLGGIAAAAIIWQVDSFLESRSQDQHSFFFLPLKVWSVIALLLGVFAAAT